ncbi:antitoxin [Georgenia yuyongxinii]|uniref:Antitoxin n=1 Tax=Georgenia yuyongxinii TaxID=2589797 RepID=A0A5B8C6E7_9MICO|nr:antitoxin [Georgenia yuyongxinii]QDC26133.1 antitoxin [Georgenia yuyongxinii]
MGFDDLARKAKDAFQSEKVQQALRSEKAETVSDTVLEKAAGMADKATGGKYEQQIAGARNMADTKIGTDNPSSLPDPRRRERAGGDPRPPVTAGTGQEGRR